MAASTNNTTIRVSVDATGVETGVNKIKAGASSVSASMDAMAKKAAQVDAAMKEAADNGFTLNARAASKLVDQYNRLEATAGKTQRQILDQRAASMGITQAFASQSAAIEEATKHTHEFGFATASSKRELLVLAHELSQGNYKKFGGSLLVLGEQTGAAGLLFSAAGIGAASFAAAVAGAAYQVLAGASAFSTLNKTVQLTGNYLGLTTGQVQAMALGLSGAGTSLVSVEEAMTALAGSGKIAGDQLALAAKVTVGFAKDTGEAVDKAAESMVKFAEDPQKALEALQGQYHTFSAAQVEVIENYIHTGDKASAYKAILEGMDEAHTRFKASAEANVGYVGRLWEALKHTVQDTANYIANVGVAASSESKLADALKRQAGLQGAVNALGAGGRDLYGYKAKLAAVNAEVEGLQRVKTATEATAAEEAKRAKAGDAALAADKYVNSNAYATPARKHSLDTTKENQDFAESVKDLDKNSKLYEQAVQRHQENLAQIDAQYAKKTRVKAVGDGAQNAELARLRGANSLIEAEGKRSESIIKAQYDAGLIDANTYFHELHDAQAKVLDDKIVNERQAIITASTKKDQVAFETATATLKKLKSDREKVDEDLTASLEKNAARRAADVSRYAQKQTGKVEDQQTGYAEADAVQSMTAREAAEYTARTALYRGFVQEQRSLQEKYSGPTADRVELAQSLQIAQDSYAEQQAALTAHLATEQAVRNDYAAQVRKATLTLAGTGTTNAEALGTAYTTAFQDASSALESFVTTGKFNFSSFASSVVADMAKIALKASESSVLSALTGSAAGGTSSGLLGLFGAAATAAASTTTGTNSYGFHLATGGHVTGAGSGTSDSIPAMLSNGEYVINARATAQHKGLLDAINSGTAARFASGGAVGSVAPASTTGASGSGGVSVSVTNNTSSGGELDEKDAADLHEHVKAFIDQRMDQKMSGQGGYYYRMKHGQI